MQTITITLNVPDGVTFAVNSGAIAAQSPPTGQVFTTSSAAETKPAGPTLEDLKQSFLAAVKKNKDDAFKALGCAKCSEVAESNYAAVIASFNAVS